MEKIPAERVLRAVSAVQSCFASASTPDEVFAALLQSLFELTESRHGLAFELTKRGTDKAAPELRAAMVPEGATGLASRMDLLRPLLNQAASNGKPLIFDKTALTAHGLEEPAVSVLAILPVINAGRALAAFILADRDAGYSEELLESLAPLRDLSGIVAGAYDEARARNLTEEALRESRLQLRQVIDLVPHHIFAIVPERGGRFIFANQALADVYGMTTEQVVGKTQRDITPIPDEEQHFLADDMEVIRSGKMKFIAEETYTDPSGKLHYLQTTKIPFKAVGSDEPAVLGICVDITEQKRVEEERKELEERFRHAQKLESLGLVAGGIAHDFNNILTSILGHASLALLGLPPGSPMRDRLAAIESSAHRAADLCQQMLAYSGKGKFTIKPVDLSAVVDEMADMLASSVSKRAVIKHVRGENLPSVEADVTQLRQILVNLVTNASDAIGANDGLITIRTGAVDYSDGSLGKLYLDTALSEGSYVFLEVTDNGCGMDHETQAKIFDPFFTTKFTGRGLGMAAVLGIVRGHRGTIKVESEPGRGTRFTIYFPASGRKAEPVSGEERTRVSTPYGTGTVLVVDDEEAVRSFAVLSLELFGYKTIGAVDGLEALELFRQRRKDISLVLLDLTMPRMSGEETCRELRRLAPEIPVILSSGYNEQEAVSQFSELGLTGFLQKPYGAPELLAQVKLGMERLSRRAGLADR